MESTSWLGRLGETWDRGASSIAIPDPNMAFLASSLEDSQGIEPSCQILFFITRTEVDNGGEPLLLVLLKETSGHGGPTSFNPS